MELKQGKVEMKRPELLVTLNIILENLEDNLKILLNPEVYFYCRHELQ